MEYLEVSEPRWVNPILNIIGVNSLRLGGLHIFEYNEYDSSIKDNILVLILISLILQDSRECGWSGMSLWENMIYIWGCPWRKVYGFITNILSKNIRASEVAWATD